MDNDICSNPLEDVPQNELRKVLQEKARILFSICDKDNKGVIIKSDMHKLTNELPLSVDQLEEVFDSLDDDANGFLTLDEFTDGFGMFLGIDTHPRPRGKSGTGDDLVPLIQVDDYAAGDMSDDEFNNFLENMGAQHMFKDEDYIHDMWKQLKLSDPSMLSNFKMFLSKIANEVRDSKIECSSLEYSLKDRTSKHDAEVQQLYKEMEEQMKAEKDQLIAEEKYKEKKVREELEAELNEKDQQLQDFLIQHSQMEKQLVHLNSIEAKTKHENVRLQKEKDTLENHLTSSEHMLKEMQNHIEGLRRQSIEERRKRARAALQVSEGIALEREGLVKQLNLLKTVNQKLLDEKDELAKAIPPLLNCSTEPSNAAIQYSRLHDNEGGEVLNSTINGLPVIGQSDIHIDDPLCSSSSFRHLSLTDDDCEVDDSFFQINESILSSNNFNLDDKKINKEKSDSLSDNEEKQIEVLNNNLQGFSGTNPFGPHYKTSSVDDKQPSHDQNANDTTSNLVEQNRKASISTPERLFKVILIGDSGVGKSSFIHRFCHNKFRSTFSATIGVDFQVKSVNVNGRTIALQLWDTAGQERFRSITKQYFRKADGIIVVYDVTSETSFKNVRNWITHVKESSEGHLVMMLVGNKTDLCESEDDRVVKMKDGSWLADEFDALFYEASAKTGFNVPEAITALSSLLQEKEDEEMEKVLKLQEAESKKKNCC